MIVKEWEPIDFADAEVKSGEGGAKTLFVRGNAPGGAAGEIEVKLLPVAYLAQPEYWRIDVFWNRENTVSTAQVPFEASLKLDGICGSKGIEIYGKNRSLKIGL
jgi:hypothetical protein